MEIHSWRSIDGDPSMDIHRWRSINGDPSMDIHRWRSGNEDALRETWWCKTEIRIWRCKDGDPAGRTCPTVSFFIMASSCSDQLPVSLALFQIQPHA
jgi:hypothetical protein